MALSRAFKKCIFYIFFDIFILQTCLQFAKKIANLFQILKVELYMLSNDDTYRLSYLDIKHGIKGGGGLNGPPPQHILVFKEPSRDRVKSRPYIDKYQRVRLVSLNKCGQPFL